MYKHLDFAIGNINHIVGNEVYKLRNIALPIGIFGNEFLDHVRFKGDTPMEMFEENNGDMELICQGYDGT